MPADFASSRKSGTPANEIQESEIDISAALDHLIKEGLVVSESQSKNESLQVKFSQDIVAFINLAKEVLSTDDTIGFLSSEYVKSMISSKKLLHQLKVKKPLELKLKQCAI